MKNYIKNHLFGIIYGFILIGFTAYALLDVFVIPHVYVNSDGSQAISVDVANADKEKALAAVTTYNSPIESDVNNNEEDSDKSESANVVSDNEASESDNEAEDNIPVFYGPQLDSTIVDPADFLEIGQYEDDSIRIIINRYRYCNTYVFVADVVVAHPDLLKTALACDTYGRNITQRTSQIAVEHNAILAINGDFYGARQNGYVLRNGMLFGNVPNPKIQDLVILNDGSFGVFNEADVSAEDVYAIGAWQILSFGPGLVVNGQINVSERQEVAHASYSNPRTAIGMIEPCHYLFVVSDGRTEISQGLSLYELATFMQAAGCKMAYNLDGGGSSTMVYKGEVLNNPCPGYGYIVERSVSDIVYIGY